VVMAPSVLFINIRGLEHRTHVK